MGVWPLAIRHSPPQGFLFHRCKLRCLLPIDPVQHTPKHIRAGDAVEAGSLFAGQTQLPALGLGEFLRRAHDGAQMHRPTEQPQRDEREHPSGVLVPKEG